MNPRTTCFMPALLVVLVCSFFATSTSHAQTYKILHAFSGGSDGAEPYADLLRDTAGNLYGTTLTGGDTNCDVGLGCGTIFKLSAAGKKTVLYQFKGSMDGKRPYSGLIRDAAGNIYGTTVAGGDPNCGAGTGCGTVFRLAAGKETVLHRFAGGHDGSGPYGRLVRDAAGNLYGTTLTGGDPNCGAGTGCGIVFKLSAAGKETVLHRFTGGTDGGNPYAGLVLDTAGNLYGTTDAGGDLSCAVGLGCGTVFKISAAGKETVLYQFTGNSDGGNPYGSLVRDKAGNLYGTTTQGGLLSCGGGSGCGTVFKVSSAGRETVLYEFAGATDGANPYADLVRDAVGNLYGTTVFGGDPNCGNGVGCGTVFQLSGAGQETVLYRFAVRTDGEGPYGGLVRDSTGNLYGTTQGGGLLSCGAGSGCGTVFELTP